MKNVIKQIKKLRRITGVFFIISANSIIKSSMQF